MRASLIYSTSTNTKRVPLTHRNHKNKPNRFRTRITDLVEIYTGKIKGPTETTGRIKHSRAQSDLKNWKRELTSAHGDGVGGRRRRAARGGNEERVLRLGLGGGATRKFTRTRADAEWAVPLWVLMWVVTAACCG